MNEDEILEKTKEACLALIHPALDQELSRAVVANLVVLAPSVPDETVAGMIVGSSWRERLLGLCFAMCKEPSKFVQPMLESLRDLRGIAIVPTCAALAVLAEKGVFTMDLSLAGSFDKDAFDGEVGWALQKAMSVAGFPHPNVGGTGPNYGQVFEDHLKLYRSILGDDGLLRGTHCE